MQLLNEVKLTAVYIPPQGGTKKKLEAAGAKIELKSLKNFFRKTVRQRHCQSICSIIGFGDLFEL